MRRKRRRKRMGKRRRRVLPLILVVLTVLTGVGILSLMRPYRPFYSREEVEKYLEQRYACAFTVEELVSEDRHSRERIWRVTAEPYPELELYAWDVWHDGSWDSLLPVYSPAVHRLHDNCLSTSWNLWGVPLMEEYGVTGLSVPESDAFGGVPYDQDTAYRVRYTDDLDAVGADLSELLGRLKALPFFRAVDSRYFIPVRMIVHEDVGFIYHEDRFSIGQDYEDGEVAERLWTMQGYVLADLDRKLKKMGVSPSLLARLDPPAAGEDFFVTGDAFAAFSCQGVLDETTRAALFPEGALYDWRTRLGGIPLLDAPVLYDYGTGEIDGRQYRCLSADGAVSHREGTGGRLFFLDVETGEAYQYGDFFLGSIEPEITGFLVKTGLCAAPEALAA